MSNNTDVDINSSSNSKKLGGQSKNAVSNILNVILQNIQDILEPNAKHVIVNGVMELLINCKSIWHMNVNTLKKRSKKDICILLQKEMV